MNTKCPTCARVIDYQPHEAGQPVFCAGCNGRVILPGTPARAITAPRRITRPPRKTRDSLDTMMMLIAIVALAMSVANSSCLVYWEYQRHRVEKQSEKMIEKMFEGADQDTEKALKQWRDAMRELNR